MPKRSITGRALFYTRDSGGRHETTPSEYVLWAQRTATQYSLRFDGTAARIDAMIRHGQSHNGDLFLDYGVTGNKLKRVGLDALNGEAMRDKDVSHVLIPHRNRLARPDNPIDGILLEQALREDGVTLVFMDRVALPTKKGQRVDLGDIIGSFIDYDTAGAFRRDLAQKMIYAQIGLAKAGFSTGGRPPYGFRRCLVSLDGTQVRQLAEGEHVRMAGHHVAWLPGPEDELCVIRRILGMLETLPASRVASTLTAEGVPTPDAGRSRTDSGVRHVTSGVWHQPTIINIARNPLLRAVVSYGRRSMGDQLRFTPEGPRPLEEEDRRPDGMPKVIANPEETRIQADSKFESLVDLNRQSRLLETLDERAGTQRGKPRSSNPGANPLGARVFDMACGWPLYRQPSGGSFRYLCGFYQQSHGASCRHNHVDGPTMTRFVLNCIRQRVLSSSELGQLEEKLRVIAQRELGDSKLDPRLESLRSQLAAVRRKRDTVATNMAMADNPDQYKAIAAVFDTLSKEEFRRDAELKAIEATVKRPVEIQAEVDAALKTIERLAVSEPDADDLSAAGDLFRALNVRVFLDFRETKPKNRIVNVLSKGVVTFGMAPAPVTLYEGPTGRRALQANSRPVSISDQSERLAISQDPAQGGESLGNISRGERI